MLKRYLFIFLLLVSKLSFEQSFITRVSAMTIGKEDVLQIEYVAENVDLQQFVLPGFNKWTVVSGPNMSTSTMQNGNMVTQETIYSVMVQPETTGTLTVPGATALIDSKPRRSNTVIIQVKNTAHLAGGQPATQGTRSSLFDQMPFEDELPSNQYLKKGEKAIDKIKNNILIRLEVSKHVCYAGEPILATYKLCTKLRSKSKVVKQPQFNGCTVVELTGDQQDQHKEIINGTEYNVFVIRKVQLVPLSAGKLELPQTSVENKVSFYDASNLSWRDLYYNRPQIPVEEQVVTLQNKPETVEVKSLPALPGGEDFSGAIGNFDISVTSSEPSLEANNTNHLLLVIQGQGNLQDATAPVIKWPEGIEAFDATESEDDDKTTFPSSGKKIFSIPFVAGKKGKYAIAPVAFTYFDAKASKYVTKTTSAFTLNIVKANKAFLPDINLLKSEEGFEERLYILLGAGVLAVLIGLVWVNGRKKPQPSPVQTLVAKPERPEEPVKPAADYLYNIRELQPDGDSSTFYKQLCSQLTAYLNSRYNLMPGQLPFYLIQHPEAAPALEQLKKLLDECSLGMYTPVYSLEEAMQHRLEAIEALGSLEKE